jgi:hypothetical protein
MIGHKAYKRVSGGWVEFMGGSVELNDEAIILFEKIFSRYLKIAYVDIVNAERSILNVYSYSYEGDILVLHRVVWRHMGDKLSYIYYLVQGDERYFGHLADPKEIEEFFSKLDIPVF